MIISEMLNNDTLIRHYSDKGMLMLQVETGAKYGEAIDVFPCPYTYEETNEPDEEVKEMTETEEKAMAYDIITGVVE